MATAKPRNYIKRLEFELAEERRQLAEASALVADFRAHIASAKFRGIANSGADSSGARVDWIATSDAESRLADIASACGYPGENH